MLMVEQYQVDTELGAEDGHDVEIVQSKYKSWLYTKIRNCVYVYSQNGLLEKVLGKQRFLYIAENLH